MAGKKNHEGKYLKSIYLWISVCFIGIQILFSGIVLTKTVQLDVKNNEELNRQTFEQVMRNVEIRDRMAHMVCESVFAAPSISQMMYSVMEDDEIYEWIRKFDTVSSPVQIANPQIHSIYVYNRHMNRFFASYPYLDFQDADLSERTEQGFSEMEPVVRNIRDTERPSEQGEKVITYVMSGLPNEGQNPDGAVIVNIDFEKFEREIEELLIFEESEMSRVLIFEGKDAGARLLNDTSENQEIAEEIGRGLGDVNFPLNRSFAMERKKILGESYGIFYNYADSLGWTIVKVQPRNEIFRSTIRQMVSILTASLFVLILVLAAAYFVSNRIYFPIGRLVRRIKRERVVDQEEMNEITILNSAYENLMTRVMDYKERVEERRIVQSYNLHSLLIDSRNIDSYVMEALRKDNGDFFEGSDGFYVCILEIDHFREFQRKLSQSDQSLYRYAIENVLEELMEGRYRYVSVSISEERLGLIVKRKESETAGDYEGLRKCFRYLNDNIREFFQITLTAAISSCGGSMEEISSLYQEAEQYLVYRYVSGKASVITIEDLPAVLEADTAIGVILESMEKHIREGGSEEVKQDFVELEACLQRQDIGRLEEAVTDTVMKIINLAVDIDRKKRLYDSRTLLQLYRKILPMETWQEMSQELQNLIRSVMDKGDPQVRKTELLAATVREIVMKEYADPGLCVQRIAEKLNMSSQYIGRICKTESGESVADMLNNYRLEKSLELMKEKHCTVNEVFEKVGITSESQYYRLFKKKYGVTPKVYLIQNR